MRNSFGEWVKMRVLSEGEMGNFNLNDYIESKSKMIGIKKETPDIHCKSGLIFSVQTGNFAYCSPRENMGPYDKVEIGYPNEMVEEFMPYIERDPDNDDPLSSAYPYVPVKVVEMVVDKNGGLAN
jgi:hypothetical protein